MMWWLPTECWLRDCGSWGWKRICFFLLRWANWTRMHVVPVRTVLTNQNYALEFYLKWHTHMKNFPVTRLSRPFSNNFYSGCFTIGMSHFSVFGSSLFAIAHNLQDENKQSINNNFDPSKDHRSCPGCDWWLDWSNGVGIYWRWGTVIANIECNKQDFNLLVPFVSITKLLQIKREYWRQQSQPPIATGLPCSFRHGKRV